jgi:hypothetical protein
VSAVNFFKSSTEKPADVWFVIERDHRWADEYQRDSLAAALRDFGAWLKGSLVRGEGYSPHDRTRRLVVTGPDWFVQPDDPTDPLLIGDAALKAVLDPEEYRYVIHGPVASALLES